MRMRRIYAYLWRGSLTRAGEPRRDREELVVVFPFFESSSERISSTSSLQSLSLRLTSLSLIFLCACPTDLSPRDIGIAQSHIKQSAFQTRLLPSYLWQLSIIFFLERQHLRVSLYFYGTS